MNICYLSGFVNIYQKTILSFGHKNRICCCLRHSLHIKRVLYTSKKLFPLLFGCFSSESINKQNAFLSISVLANKFQQCTFFLRVLKQANLLSCVLPFAFRRLYIFRQFCFVHTKVTMNFSAHFFFKFLFSLDFRSGIHCRCHTLSLQARNLKIKNTISNGWIKYRENLEVFFFVVVQLSKRK